MGCISADNKSAKKLASNGSELLTVPLNIHDTRLTYSKMPQASPIVSVLFWAKCTIFVKHNILLLFVYDSALLYLRTWGRYYVRGGTLHPEFIGVTSTHSATLVTSTHLSWNSMGPIPTPTATRTSSPTSARESLCGSRRAAARAEVGVSGDFPVQLATSRTCTTIIADLSADLSDMRAFPHEDPREDVC